MRKIKWLMLAILVGVIHELPLPAPLFGYRLLENVVSSGATNASSGSYRLWGVLGIAEGYKVVGIEEKEILCSNFYLTTYPNPASYGKWIEYGIPKPSSVSLKIHDITGREIWTFTTDAQKPGIYKAYWNGTDGNGKETANGIYFIRMTAGEFKATRKLTVLR